jgi:CelD/BcsL family acetyltransferase involved in cellulose biosynthesis
METLRKTYGYEPLAFTTSPADTALQNGLLLCRVNSSLTGRRLVSLPFSDHCEPLVDSSADLSTLILAAEQQLHEDKVRYVELRPISAALDGAHSLFRSTYSSCLHQLDLRPDLDAIYNNCHKSTRRNIRRAQREGVKYEDGRSMSLLDAFFRMYVSTRRRHKAPPQPKSWFINLITSFGEALKIRVAYHHGRAIAAILTLHFRNTVTYKYSCSDQHFNNLGATHFLIWKTIEEAKQEGLRVLDLGRSECSNKGLVEFKNRFGSTPSTLIYSRLTRTANSRERYESRNGNWGKRIARAVASKMPERVFCTLGSLTYKHIG